MKNDCHTFYQWRVEWNEAIANEMRFGYLYISQDVETLSVIGIFSLHSMQKMNTRTLKQRKKQLNQTKAHTDFHFEIDKEQKMHMIDTTEKEK